MYLFIPQVAPKHISILSRIADKLALKESHVEAGGIVVDELEEEHLHRQFVLILQVGLGNFCQMVKGNKIDFKYINQKRNIFSYTQQFQGSL